MHPSDQQILDTPVSANNSGASTVRGYLVAIVAAVWDRGSDFSGKRPFGSSGWYFDIYTALAKAGHICATFDENDYIDEISDVERDKADSMISSAIQSLGTR